MAAALHCPVLPSGPVQAGGHHLPHKPWGLWLRDNQQQQHPGETTSTQRGRTGRWQHPWNPSSSSSRGQLQGEHCWAASHPAWGRGILRANPSPPTGSAHQLLAFVLVRRLNRSSSLFSPLPEVIAEPFAKG